MTLPIEECRKVAGRFNGHTVGAAVPPTAVLALAAVVEALAEHNEQQRLEIDELRGRIEYLELSTP